MQTPSVVREDLDASNRLAFAMAAEGRWEEAEEILVRIIGRNKKYLRVNKKDDSNLSLSVQFPDASQVHVSWLSYRIGHSLFHSRQPLAAREYFRRAMDLSERSRSRDAMWATCANFLLLCNFEVTTADCLAENDALLDAWQEQFGAQCWHLLGRSAQAFLARRHKEAVDLIDQARHVEADNPFEIPTLQKSMHCVLPWEEMRWEALTTTAAPAPAWELDLRHEVARGSVVHLCAADAGYFAKFGEAFVRSALKAGFSDLIHLHVVNPDARSRELVNLIHGLPGIKVNFSFSEYRDQPHTKAYYATARFIFASRVMDLYGCDLLISDIDVALQQDAKDFALQFAGADVGVRVRPVKNYFPWKTVIVNLVYLRNCEASRNALSYVGKYFWLIVGDKSRSEIWGVDQSAFFFAVTLQPDATPILDMNKLSDRYVSFAGNDKIAWASRILSN
ncbi:hypothetical protein ACFFMP_01560 [Pseudoroseomonas cervicalis]|nr:hypothetical protein [Pseudoroseomonas cervicalis]